MIVTRGLLFWLFFDALHYYAHDHGNLVILCFLRLEILCHVPSGAATSVADALLLLGACFLGLLGRAGLGRRRVVELFFFLRELKLIQVLLGSLFLAGQLRQPVEELRVRSVLDAFVSQALVCVLAEHLVDYLVDVVHMFGVHLLVLLGQPFDLFLLELGVNVVVACNQLVDGLRFLVVLREVREEIRQLNERLDFLQPQAPRTPRLLGLVRVDHSDGNIDEIDYAALLFQLVEDGEVRLVLIGHLFCLLFLGVFLVICFGLLFFLGLGLNRLDIDIDDRVLLAGCLDQRQEFFQGHVVDLRLFFLFLGTLTRQLLVGNLVFL